MIRFPSERNREASIWGGMRRFSQVIDELNLKDIPLQGRLLYFEWGVKQPEKGPFGSFFSHRGLGCSLQRNGTRLTSKASL